LADLIAVGPLRDLHLGIQLGLQPVHTARIGAGGRSAEGCRGCGGLCEGLEYALERSRVEARADLAGITELAVIVLNTDEQGTELITAPRRIGVAADHEFLALIALLLEPIAAARGFITCVGALGDDAFQVMMASVCEYCVVFVGLFFF